ncbi:MAG: MBL fold metallo-hydrolase [Pseudolabrys sp.]|nr:MBL fold metallo-hydrolase [Pseudolabrys sp.]
MTTITRRSLLAAAALGVAARPWSGMAATGPYRFRHGAFEVTVVSDGHLVLPVRFLAPDAPAQERAALLARGGETGPDYHAPTNVTLVRAGSELILVDMGSGDRFMPTAGRLWDNLKAAGIDKTRITKVVFTHGHPDHLWGALDELDELALPNAVFYVAAAEWDFWMSDGAAHGLPTDRAGFVTGARRRYAAIRERMVMTRPNEEIVPGLHVVATPGHTQGHISLALEGGDGLLIGGDALTHPLISFLHPEWRPLADHVPELAVVTRRNLLERLVSERSHLIGFHLPYPGHGLVERKDGAYRFVPLA